MRYFLLFLLVCSSVHSQNELIKLGLVNSEVPLYKTDSITYSVYLPKSYNVDIQFPAVFVLTEDGSSTDLVHAFSEGADLTETLIFGLNVPLNDTLVSAIAQSESFINTLYDLYAIDKNQLMLAGMDTAAVVASSAAHLNPQLRAVIAINDLFLDRSLLKKNENVHFSVLIGDESGNYYKVQNRTYLNQSEDFMSASYVYDDDGIPNRGFLTAALTSIYLERELPKDQIEQFYEADLAFADLLIKQQKHLIAFDFLNTIKKKYRRKVDLKKHKELLRDLRGNPTFRLKRIQKNAILDGEQRLADDFSYYLNEDVKNAYFDNLGWWNFQLSDLDSKIDSTSLNDQQRKAAKRLKGFVKTIAEERYAQMEFVPATFEQELFINVLRTLIDPTNYEAFIETISLSAREGDENAALFYLEELLRAGYQDYDRLYTIEGTTALRISEPFNRIVKAYLGKSEYY